MTVTITIQGSSITAAADSYTTLEDTALIKAAGAGLLANDSDTINGATMTVSAVNGAAAAVGNQITLTSGAQLTVNADGSFSYSPAANFNGPDSFSYTVGDGTSTATATVSLTDHLRQ